MLKFQSTSKNCCSFQQPIHITISGFKESHVLVAPKLKRKHPTNQDNPETLLSILFIFDPANQNQVFCLQIRKREHFRISLMVSSILPLPSLPPNHSSSSMHFEAASTIISRSSEGILGIFVLTYFLGQVRAGKAKVLRCYAKSLVDRF